MTFDPSQFLSWKDGLLIGVIVGQWLNARGNRDRGRRLGDVEAKVAELVGSVLGGDKTVAAKRK